MPPRQAGGIQVHPHSFLTLALDRGEWSNSCPSHFTSQEEPWYPLEFGWAPELVQMVMEKRKFLASAMIQTPHHPAHSTVTILTELSQLLIHTC